MKRKFSKFLPSFLLIVLSISLLSSCTKMNDWEEPVDCIEEDCDGDGRPTIVLNNFYATGLEAMLSSNDPNDLLAAINATNELPAATEIYTISNEINDHFIDNYSINLLSEYNDDREKVIATGILISGWQKGVFNNAPVNDSIWLADDEGFSHANLTQAESCFYTAVGSVLGVTQIKGLIASLKAGAARPTIINSIKLMGKRVATAVTLVITIYQLGDCLEWW